ncbi:MAG: hypothetical protein LBH70_05265 [Spirochaetaceae bacterium]|nr:hypothetical protein [Spirochaetaceae bacterium]
MGQALAVFQAFGLDEQLFDFGGNLGKTPGSLYPQLVYGFTYCKFDGKKTHFNTVMRAQRNNPVTWMPALISRRPAGPFAPCNDADYIEA